LPETAYTHRTFPGMPEKQYIIWGGVILEIAQDPIFSHRAIGAKSYSHRSIGSPPYTHRTVTKPE
jgi:hypothetical protein